MIATETNTADLQRDKQREKNKRAIALLRKWVEEGDEAEQKATFEALREGLNAHHSSGRIIYP